MGFGTGALVLQQTSVAAPRFASISQVNGSSLDAFRNGADLPLCSHLQSHRNGIAQGSGQAGFATTRSSNKLLQTRIDSETSRVVAKIRKGKKSAETEYPWPEKLKGDEQEGYLEFLSGFKPLPTKPKPVTLPFERPLVDLENKIDEVRICIFLTVVFHRTLELRLSHPHLHSASAHLSGDNSVASARCLEAFPTCQSWLLTQRARTSSESQKYSSSFVACILGARACK